MVNAAESVCVCVDALVLLKCPAGREEIVRGLKMVTE